MIGKLIATTILLLLAFYAFWGDALGTGYLINPFGIMFLTDLPREGETASRDGSELASRLI